VDRLVQPLALFRSLPKGFSTTTRFQPSAALAMPEDPKPVDITEKNGGGGEVEDAVAAVPRSRSRRSSSAASRPYRSHRRTASARRNTLGEALPDGAIDRLGARELRTACSMWARYSSS